MLYNIYKYIIKKINAPNRDRTDDLWINSPPL